MRSARAAGDGRSAAPAISPAPVAPAAASGEGSPAEDGSAPGRFSPQLMYAAARLYHLEHATQAEVAERLGTSRATVSRLLSEARRAGIVRIEVVPPVTADPLDLASRTAAALGVRSVRLADTPDGVPVGAALAPALSSLLAGLGLLPGDVLLVSSGRTVYEASMAELPRLPGIVVVPMVGGQDEPAPWYQTNEIARHVASTVGGSPRFLYAPALPAAGLHERLVEDPSIRGVLQLWTRARCALVGIGAPPLVRQSIPSFAAGERVLLRESVGDVTVRFFDRDGEVVDLPGSERLIATSPELLRRLPTCIALAVGDEKVPAILAAARAGFFTDLVTNPATAEALIALAQRLPDRVGRGTRTAPEEPHDR